MAQEFRVYKPKKDGNGSASAFQIANKPRKRGDKQYDNIVVFLTLANQIGTDSDGNASFSWKNDDNRIVVQLGETDIGEFLAVLKNRKPGVGMLDKEGASKGIFHENSKGNTIIKFEFNQRGDGFNLSVSSKRDGNNLRIGHGVSIGEATLLEKLLEEYVSRKYQWQNV